jgi:gliding motility-associated-like protein
VNPTANTLYVATARNQFGCSVNDTADIKVYAAFTAQAVATPVFVCAEDSVRINVDPPGKIISWSPATGLSASNIYNPLVYPATNITYTANLSDSAGCFTSTADVVVNVKSLPAVNAGPDRTYPYNTVFTITPIYGGTISNYVWSPATSLSCTNCANPGGTALEGITYTIQVTSDSGCIAKDTISIFVECKYSNLLMPSAFTPNNDANNDRYFPIARGITTIKRFLIFNRLGQLLFEVKNFRPNDSSAGWDGRYMGQEQSPGAYVYLLEAVCDQGGIITKKESFLLIR